MLLECVPNYRELRYLTLGEEEGRGDFGLGVGKDANSNLSDGRVAGIYVSTVSDLGVGG